MLYQLSRKGIKATDRIIEESVFYRTYQIYPKIISDRLLRFIESLILGKQHGCDRERSTIGNICMLKQTVEKAIEHNGKTHLDFVDLEKSFEKLDSG